jgi:predicted DNA-binding transcriptional regulator AlpA
MRTNPEPDTMPGPMLDLAAVMQLSSLSRTSLYRLARAGSFPKPVALTPTGGRVGWRAQEVMRWIADPQAWAPDSTD